LVIEGFKEAAEEFIEESGLEEFEEVKRLDLDSIDYRLKVRQAIQSGEIDSAVRELNNFDPEILDSNPNVYFHLKLQEFLEMIRTNRKEDNGGTDDCGIDKIMEAIEFARENLAPIAQEQAGGQFLEELEDAMSLLAAEMGATWPSSALLLPENRLKTAKEVNAAILSSQAQPEVSKLPEILGLLQWAQNKLDERVVFPKLIDPIKGVYENFEQ
jgi:glucose-induced degradation protein 8